MAFDPYSLLGVPVGASDGDIRRAYRELARELHPDLNASPEAEERFKELAQAYAVLSDPQRRRLYDTYGEESLSPYFNPGEHAPDRGEADDASHPRFTRQPPPPGGSRSAGAAEARQGNARPPRQSPGRSRRPAGAVASEPRAHRTPPSDTGSLDILLPVEIDFATAMSGGKVRATTPAGSVVTLDVPRGADSGHRQRIRGQGRRGRGGAPPGDLVVELHVRSHPYFRREGSDLVLDLPVTILEATRGARIQIPTPDGWVRLRIPEGSRGGERLRLRGRGPAGADGRRGDLYIHLSIRLPEQLDAAARHVERIETLYRGSIRENLEL